MKTRRRILQQIGTPRAGEELAACALKGRDVLASLFARLLQIGNLANAQLEECKTLIENARRATVICFSMHC